MTCLIPICFYPIKKILVDDDHAFSQSVLLKMHKNNFTGYTTPKEALKYLLEEYKPSLTKVDLLTKNLSIEDSGTQHTINIDINKIKLTGLGPLQRDISVLFIDYHMPDMTGIELLNEIQSLPIKKVLITGINDDKIAIDAFNTGLIDAYIRKDDPDFANKMQNMTEDLEWKYFIDLSSFIPDISKFGYLKNPHFVAAFKEYLHHAKIKSFYLIHTNGNFIVQNLNNESKYILVRSRHQLKELALIAKEDGASKMIVNNLNQGKIIPYCDSREYWEIPANQWNEFSYPAMEVTGSNDLVWSIINHKTLQVDCYDAIK